MSAFKERSRKKSDDDQVVVLFQGAGDAWYVGAEDDPTCHPFPMGAFISREAAQRWADHRFEGGTWSS